MAESLLEQLVDDLADQARLVLLPRVRTRRASFAFRSWLT
jgi:hypothetical protein